MKKLILIILILFCIPLPLFADEPDEELPVDTPASIRESAREVIRLGIEDKALIKMTRTMLENRFSERQVLKAHDVLVEAKSRDLPAEPLMDKLYEGISKKIQAENIIQAMERVRSRYETANNYAQNMTQDREEVRSMTKDIAECMAAGMGENDVARIMEMLRQRKNEMNMTEREDLNRETLRTVRGMARTGARSEDIINVVDNSFRRGYGSGEMRLLGNTFMKQAVTSSSPSDLVRSYSTAIRNGLSPDSISIDGLSGQGGGISPPGPGPGPDSGPGPIPGPTGNIGGRDESMGPGGPPPGGSMGGGGGGGRR